jgi:hypothetical protein
MANVLPDKQAAAATGGTGVFMPLTWRDQSHYKRSKKRSTKKAQHAAGDVHQVGQQPSSVAASGISSKGLQGEMKQHRHSSSSSGCSVDSSARSSMCIWPGEYISYEQTAAGFYPCPVAFPYPTYQVAYMQPYAIPPAYVNPQDNKRTL